MKSGPYRFYYGWITVAVSFLTLFFVLGTRSSFGLFYAAILIEYGWSRAETAGAFSLMMAVHSLMAPITGILIDRFGPRKLFPVGGLILTLGFAAAGFITKMWQFYIYFGVVTACGINILSYAPHMSLIPKWFLRKKGLASGLVLAGIGTGTLILALLIEFTINKTGWRHAFLILAGIILCVVVPINALLHRGSPEEVGQVPDGSDKPREYYAPFHDQNPGHVTKISHYQNIWTFKAASKTIAFWCLAVTGFLQGLVITSIVVHLAIHVVDTGYSSALAASLVGLIGLLGSLGGILFGFFSDRVGRMIGYSLGCGAAFAGMMSLLFVRDTSSPWLLYSFVMFYGLGQGAIMSVVAAATGDLFPGNALGRIISSQAVTFGVGSAIGAYMSGLLYDLTGSYVIPFTLNLLFLSISAVTIGIAAPQRR